MNSHISKLIDRDQTLEQLENDFWGNPSQGVSSLIASCYKLRQKKIKDFEVEDFRLLIGQQIGLPFLVPLAIELLDTNAFMEGDYHEGDLLKSVLNSKIEFWKENPILKKDIIEIFKKNRNKLEQEISLNQKIKDELLEAYNKILGV